MRDNFTTAHGGSENAGKPIVLDDGMSVQYLQWSPLDVALIDFSTLNAEDCSRIWGVPRDLLALDTHGTYGAAVQRSQDFVTLCLGPWIEKIQEEFNTKLFYTSETRSGKYYFEFDRSMFLQLDKEAEAKTLALQVQSSLLTPNEARQKMGLNPVEGGDDLYGNINTLPLSALVEVATAKYLSSKGEEARGKETAAESAKPSKTPTANPQKDTAHEPAGQP